MIPSDEFYSTAAQIVPVLLLLLAVENRTLLTRRTYAQQAASEILFVAAAVLGFLMLAECAAIAGLLGSDLRWLPAAVICGLGVGFHTVIAGYVGPVRKEL